MTSSPSTVHARAIADGLLFHPDKRIMPSLIRNWLLQEDGAMANLNAVVALLAAHPNDEEAVQAAERLQSGVRLCAQLRGCNAVRMLAIEQQLFVDSLPHPEEGEKESDE